MPSALRSAPTSAGEVAFELEQFEEIEPARLLLRGRWFGVRGRRFVRPTLTLRVDGARRRSLAELEHKPWAAEDGASWVATFPFEGSDVGEAELAVAPGITVLLPAPGADLGEHRIAAQSSGGGGAGPVQAGERPPTPRLDRELTDALAEVGRLREEVQRLRHDLEAAEAARLEALGAAARRDAALSELEAVQAEREGALRERDRARAESERARAERDAAQRARDQARAERNAAQRAGDRALAERGTATRALKRALAERDDALRRAAADRDAALKRAAAERDGALGAREAPPAPPPPQPAGREPARRVSRAASRSWLQRLIAMLALVGAAIAFLIVAHPL